MGNFLRGAAGSSGACHPFFRQVTLLAVISYDPIIRRDIFPLTGILCYETGKSGFEKECR